MRFQHLGQIVLRFQRVHAVGETRSVQNCCSRSARVRGSIRCNAPFQSRICGLGQSFVFQGSLVSVFCSCCTQVSLLILATQPKRGRCRPYPSKYNKPGSALHLHTIGVDKFNFPKLHDLVLPSAAYFSNQTSPPVSPSKWT